MATNRVCLSAKTIEGFPLTLEGVDDIHGCNSPALRVVGVCDSIMDEILEEDLEDATGFLVDETRQTLDTAPTSKTADSSLRNPINVAAKNLAVAHGNGFQRNASLASAHHSPR